MIAIGSHKPFSESEEYAATQAMAATSWHEHFSAIYYFGNYEQGLNHDKVLFAKSSGYPTIKEMAEFASHCACEYVAMINADIVIGPRIGEVEKKLNELSLPAAVSYRHEFDPADPKWMDSAERKLNDRGMDIFVAKPEIWRMVAKRIPEYLRIGHNRWDSWVCGFFCEHLGYGFRHFTDYRCVFHPKHGGRCVVPHGNEIADGVDEYFTRAKRPSPL